MAQNTSLTCSASQREPLTALKGVSFFWIWSCLWGTELAGTLVGELACKYIHFVLFHSRNYAVICENV